MQFEPVEVKYETTRNYKVGKCQTWKQKEELELCFSRFHHRDRVRAFRLKVSCCPRHSREVSRKIFNFPRWRHSQSSDVALKFVRVVTFFPSWVLISSHHLARLWPSTPNTQFHLFSLIACSFPHLSFCPFFVLPFIGLAHTTRAVDRIRLFRPQHETKRQDDRENLWSTVVRCEAKIDPQAAARHECGERDDSTRWKIFFFFLWWKFYFYARCV